MATDREIILVKWYDAKFLPGTYNVEAIADHRMATFESIGYLVSRDAITKVIAGERNDQGEFRDITLIPSGSIISVNTLITSSLV